MVEVWRAEHKSLLLATNIWCLANFQELDGVYYDWHLQASWEGFLMAKRSQPSVVLPKDCHANNSTLFRNGFISALKAVKHELAAAGIKYTIGE